MNITKSSRHSKITGEFGEALILYWLSRDGFECARIDHTGIDLLARNRHTNELMGISVKTRSRFVGTEGQVVNIPRGNFVKARIACDAFNCQPYFAIVVDAAVIIRCFLLPLPHLEELCGPKGSTAYWGMSQRHLSSYSCDPLIKCFELHASTLSWWPSPDA